MGLVTRQKCSQTENTVCVCDQGYFCVSEDGDDCAECSPHTPCRPGQRVRARGEPQTLGALTPGLSAQQPRAWSLAPSEKTDPGPKPMCVGGTQFSS